MSVFKSVLELRKRLKWRLEIGRAGVGNLSGRELFWMSGGRRSGVKGWGIECKVLLCLATDLLEGGLDWRWSDGVVEW